MLTVAAAVCQLLVSDVVKKNYVNINVVAEKDGEVITIDASGVRVGKKIFLTNYHVVNQVAKVGAALPVIFYSKKLDLAIVQWDEEEYVPYKIVKPVWGEEVCVISNAIGLGASFTRHIVSQVNKDKSLIYPALAPGSSGAGVWNKKDELVGIVQGVVMNGRNPLFTVIISGDVVAGFLIDRITKELEKGDKK